MSRTMRSRGVSSYRTKKRSKRRGNKLSRRLSKRRVKRTTKRSNKRSNRRSNRRLNRRVSKRMRNTRKSFRRGGATETVKIPITNVECTRYIFFTADPRTNTRFGWIGEKKVRFYTLKVTHSTGPDYYIDHRWSEILKFIDGLENQMKISREKGINESSSDKIFRLSYYAKMVKVYSDPNGYVSAYIKSEGGRGGDSSGLANKRKNLINEYFKIMSGEYRGTIEARNFNTSEQKRNLLEMVTTPSSSAPFKGELFGTFFDQLHW